MRISAKLFKLLKKNRTIILLSALILCIEGLFFSLISYPSNPLYKLRKVGLTSLIILQSTHKAKAKIYLNESTRLQGHVDMLLKQRSSDQELKDTAGELMNVEQQAINQMDLAAKAGMDIKNEVEVLCDNLIKQQTQLKQAIVQTQKIASLPLEQYANLTKVLLDESPEW